eukprot:m.434940 g.434940  ORF g.434940 m.434940 type:complete len:337 (-) comp20254_c2_seq2:151-1161(-)
MPRKGQGSRARLQGAHHKRAHGQHEPHYPTPIPSSTTHALARIAVPLQSLQQHYPTSTALACYYFPVLCVSVIVSVLDKAAFILGFFCSWLTPVALIDQVATYEDLKQRFKCSRQGRSFYYDRAKQALAEPGKKTLSERLEQEDEERINVVQNIVASQLQATQLNTSLPGEVLRQVARQKAEDTVRTKKREIQKKDRYTQEAETLYKRALSIHQKSDPRSLGAADSMHNLGDLYLRKGRVVDGKKLLEDALKIRVEKLGPLDEQSCYTRDVLASHYRSQGRHNKIKPLYKGIPKDKRGDGTKRPQQRPQPHSFAPTMPLQLEPILQGLGSELQTSK